MNTGRQPNVAADYMQRDLVTITPNDTLRDALSLMTENHVTGLPVVDERSRCIGLITSNDILNYEEERTGDQGENRIVNVFDPENQQWDSVTLSAFGLEGIGDTRVSEVMTRDLIWVHRDTPLNDVARRMINERVHRVLVMDEASHLFGVLSATDFVRFVAES